MRRRSAIVNVATLPDDRDDTTSGEVSVAKENLISLQSSTERQDTRRRSPRLAKLKGLRTMHANVQSFSLTLFFFVFIFLISPKDNRPAATLSGESFCTKLATCESNTNDSFANDLSFNLARLDLKCSTSHADALHPFKFGTQRTLYTGPIMLSDSSTLAEYAGELPCLLLSANFISLDHVCFSIGHSFNEMTKAL